MAAVCDNQARQRTSDAFSVAAAECAGMRRLFECPEIERVDRLLRLLAGPPSALRG